MDYDRITLKQALEIIAGAFAKAREMNLKPLSVVVLDAGGHLIAFQRQDNSSNMRFEVARAKAAGALTLGVSSRTMGNMAAERPNFMTALNHLAHGGVLPVPGGLLVKGNANASIIGAVGVTGDVSDSDEACGLAGIQAAGFTVLN